MSYVFPNSKSPPSDMMIVYFEPRDDLTAKELYCALSVGFGDRGRDGTHWFPKNLPCLGKDAEKVRLEIDASGAGRHFRWEVA